MDWRTDGRGKLLFSLSIDREKRGETKRNEERPIVWTSWAANWAACENDETVFLGLDCKSDVIVSWLILFFPILFYFYWIFYKIYIIYIIIYKFYKDNDVK